MVRVKIIWNTVDNSVTNSRELDLTDNGLLTIQRASEFEQSHIVCSLLGVEVDSVRNLELKFLNYEDYE